MRKLLIVSGLLGAASVIVFWFLTMPQTIAASELPDYDGDPVKGRGVLYASGCASCHAAPGAKGDDKFKLSGIFNAFGTQLHRHTDKQVLTAIFSLQIGGTWQDFLFIL